MNSENMSKKKVGIDLPELIRLKLCRDDDFQDRFRSVGIDLPELIRLKRVLVF